MIVKHFQKATTINKLLPKKMAVLKDSFSLFFFGVEVAFDAIKGKEEESAAEAATSRVNHGESRVDGVRCESNLARRLYFRLMHLT